MIGYTIVGYFKMNKEQTTLNNRTDFNDTVNIIDSAELRKELYEDCMRRPFSELERTEEVKRAEEELSDYLKNKYNVSIAYEDLTIGYSYTYNVDAIYYGASTIKALDALYIYTKAAQGELNLDDTMVYTSEYKWGSSREMSKYKYGDKVSLRNLVKFAITVSDNTAHQMLVSYIGRENLKAFGNSLGAKNTLLGSADNFGNTTALDTMIYMKAINSFINSNVELGAELKSYFVQADQNGLGFPELGIEAAHKYGEYDYFYHDIGIVYDKNPYVITIMTLEGNKNFVDIIKDINSRVYKLHNLYYSNKDSLCQLEIYAE
jgi:hypothetical protein